MNPVTENGSIAHESDQFNIDERKITPKRQEIKPTDLQVSQILLDSLKCEFYSFDDINEMSKFKGLIWKIINKNFSDVSLYALSSALTSSDSKNSLVLQSCYVTQKAAKKIFAVIVKNKTFKALQIEKCWFEEKAFFELRRAIAVGDGALNTIKIVDMECTGVELLKLIRELIKKNAYTLRLENCTVTSFSQKEALELQKILIDEKGCLSAIEILNLKVNDNNGYAAIYHAIIQAKISLLQIEGCCIDANSGIGSALLSALASGECSLQTLNFYGVTFDVDSFTAIATGILALDWLPPSVTTLGFESCGLDYKFGEVLNYLLTWSHKLKILNLQSNANLGSSIGIQKRLSLSRSLDGSKPLINESGSKSKPRAIPMFTKGIQGNQNLELLNLANCWIDEEDYEDLFNDALRDGSDEIFRINLEGNGLVKKREQCEKSKRLLTKGYSPRAFSSEDEISKNRRTSRENIEYKSPSSPRYKIGTEESRFKIKSGASKNEPMHIITGEKARRSPIISRNSQNQQISENITVKTPSSTLPTSLPLDMFCNSDALPVLLPKNGKIEEKSGHS
ncbi:MAG: hypothetical protein H0W50_03070 [Parachlamydiaceae bacterium]|nr:hypothetical protein [Parachlamydiaceae bacterium]